MKKIVLVFGLICGAIVSGVMAISMLTTKECGGAGNMIVGFGSMILAFSLIFIGVKTYRDKHNSGTVTFGRAFLMGVYIALISSTMYVATWSVVYKYGMPNFMEKYSASMIKTAESSGKSKEVIQKEIAQIEGMRKDYDNPVFFTLYTYSEILPVGIIVSLISALILKKKNKDGSVPAVG